MDIHTISSQVKVVLQLMDVQSACYIVCYKWEWLHLSILSSLLQDPDTVPTIFHSTFHHDLANEKHVFKIFRTEKKKTLFLH